MLDIRYIRENTDKVKASLLRRGGDYGIDKLTELDKKRLGLVKKGEDLKRQKNEVSQLIGVRKKAGEDTTEIQGESRKLGEKIEKTEIETKRIAVSIREALLAIPNVPHESVPFGEGDSDNVEVRKWGEPVDFDFLPKNHVEIGEGLNILDFARAAKLAGSRFSLSKGTAAAMERALINFMVDTHTSEAGYVEIAPPYLVNSEAMTGTGQLPKFAEDLYKIENTDYWLIPTSEVPLTNIFSNEILLFEDLPISMCSFTPCFRAEAGSYGRDTTGLIRQHQFNKVELVKLVAPEDGEKQLEKITENAEDILKKLNLPYRVVTLSTGDLGFSATKTYDIEVWVPSQGKYREISSCSLFTDYQARRMNIRFKRDKKAKPEYVYTLNGSGLAVGRTLVAILENYQNKNGTVTIPEVLQSYMGNINTIEKTNIL
ncbi:MAG TPA: serine--tRNA ligase [Nitrospinota bacterium]|nr:serine--tRNA ligase [Nitrospinota bacterium]|tara:strand:- start:27639 stop:28925 length:1287 start_codon:yes stop_codon:yes gene_type:complete